MRCWVCGQKEYTVMFTDKPEVQCSNCGTELEPNEILELINELKSTLCNSDSSEE